MEILAIVDDLLSASKISGELEPKGNSVKIVSRLSVALVQAHSRRPAAVIVDLGIGNGDPYEVIRILKNELGLPVLAFTNHTDLKGMEKARSAGCDKVVSRSQFFGHIGEVMGSIILKYPHNEQ